MSEDLIRRSDAREVIMWGSKGLSGNVVDDICDKIDAIPTIEPKRGEWIDFKNGWKCNACKKWSSERSNFCPNCGAEMRGKDNE